MLTSFNFVSFPTIFLILLLFSILSSFIFINKKVTLNFVRIHVWIISLPPIVALIALISTKESMIIGPFRFDTLSWLLAVFVLTIGLIVQRYSVRYLLGDDSYRKYFALLTITTIADSVAWLSDDLRLLLLCWGITLFGLTLLMKLKREWKITLNVARVTSRLFLLSWFVLLLAIIWIAQITGHWQLSLILTNSHLAQIGSWERTLIDILLIVAVLIPAGQYPFGRWLLDSVVTPTPISAIMHAGIVNAGGIMLTRFSPLFSSDIAHIFLLVLSSMSVLIGTGIMLVQVDYKRQLVGSTMAQMGFMLVQCALGAYWAAIAHAVLHGLFKATLFLNAGVAIQHNKVMSEKQKPYSFSWTITGILLGFLVGIGFLITSPQESYQYLSAFIIGWSVSSAWNQLVAYGLGSIGRIVGLSLIAGVSFVFIIIHSTFFRLLHESFHNGMHIPIFVSIILIIIFMICNGLSIWLARYGSSTLYSVIYLWLIRLSEPRYNSIESHPKYLTKSLSQGGH